MNLQKLSIPLLQSENNGELTLSVFSGELTPEIAAKSVARVKVAFPSLQQGFFSVLIERMKEKGFSDQRMIESVNYVIDNCQFPVPTMANFLSYDKRVKVYCYNEVCGLVTSKGFSFENFCRIKINGSMYYIKKSDKDLYNIPEEM